MANSLLTISEITNEALMILENELVIADKVNREYDDRFGIDGAKIGYTINIRRPARFTVSAGPALQVQDFVETSTQVSLTNQAHVDTQFITSDLLLSMDMFSQRVLKPKIAALANSVDYTVALNLKNATGNISGTPGTLPTDGASMLTSQAILDLEAVPRDGNRNMVMDPLTNASLIQGLKGLFNPQSTLSEQWRKGLVSRDTLGANWYMDQNIVTHTWGSWASGSTVKYTTTGASSAVKSSGWADNGTLQLTGFSNSTAVVNVGDTFVIGTAALNGVFLANPQSRVGSRQLRSFVVLPTSGSLTNGTFTPVTDVFGNVVGGTYTSDGSGNLQITIAECIIYGGQFQNVNGLAPVNNAVITPTGTSVTGPQNLLFHKDAFTLVSADLPLPGGVDMAARASHKDVGFSMRVVRQYTINNDALPTRIDILYGTAPLYRSLGSRVSG